MRKLLLGLLLILPLAVAAQTTDTRAYRFGVFPYLTARKIVESYGPMSHGLSRALGAPVMLETSGSFADFLKDVHAGRFDLAYIQPFDYIDVVVHHGYIPMVRQPVPLVTEFYVRDDSPYKTLADLRGRVVAMPPPQSGNARMALHALSEAHLTPGLDLEVRYLAAHDSCLHQMWSGDAAACASSATPAEAFQRQLNANLRVIYQTPPLPHALIVAHPRVPPAERARMLDYLTGLIQTPEGRAVLNQAALEGLVPAKPEDYAPMRAYDTASAPAKAAPAGANPPKELLLGVRPYVAQRQMAEAFAPVLAPLSRSAGVPVHLRTALNVGSFMDNLRGAVYDLVQVQPYDYAEASKAGYLPLAAMTEALQGTFFVRQSSDFRRIADFKGKLVAMPPEDSALARLGKQALLDAGLHPGRDVTIQYRATHDSCLVQVQQGQADSCVSRPQIVDLVAARSIAGLKTLGQTDKLPGLVFMAHQRLPPALRERLREEMIGWKNSRDGRHLLTVMNMGALGPVNVADYQHLSPARP